MQSRSFTKAQYQWTALMILIHGVMWLLFSLASFFNIPEPYISYIFNGALFGQFTTVPLFQFCYITVRDVNYTNSWTESLFLTKGCFLLVISIISVTLPLIVSNPVIGSFIYGFLSTTLALYILTLTRKKAPL